MKHNEKFYENFTILADSLKKMRITPFYEKEAVNSRPHDLFKEFLYVFNIENGLLAVR